ncbi:MAG: DUF6036 family nucleotidyltransferase [Acidobacteriota bacterium]
MNETPLTDPWLSFLAAIDDFIDDETCFHCLGGFVVTLIYRANRSTSDLDILTLVQSNPNLLAFSGFGSALHKRLKVYLDPVGIAKLPEDYEDRLSEIFPGMFKRLKLFSLDPYDLALAKIERNIERDRDDVKHLANVVPFDLEILKRRYYDELRPYLGIPEREDLTLKLWIEMIEESRE